MHTHTYQHPVKVIRVVHVTHGNRIGLGVKLTKIRELTLTTSYKLCDLANFAYPLQVLLSSLIRWE